MPHLGDSQIFEEPDFQRLLSSCLETLERGIPVDAAQLRRDHPKHADEVLKVLEDHLVHEASPANFTR